jgi:beta-glucosidase
VNARKSLLQLGGQSRRFSASVRTHRAIYVDLGSVVPITNVTLVWEEPHAKAYKIQFSDDALTWTDVFSTTSGQGWIESIPAIGAARYVRMLGLQRATGWGYSIYEIQVF